jgi:hypothetical protein
MLDQSSADRIEVHVVQFFVLLPKAPYVEIVKAALPEARMPQQRFVIPESELRGGKISPSVPQEPGNALLQHLHHSARGADIWFADQQVDVFGHDHVSEEREIVAVADLAQDFEEDVATAFGSEERQTTVTTARDEVQVSQAIAPFKPVFIGSSG